MKTGSNSPGASPTWCTLPPGTKTGLSFAGPPQIGFVFDPLEEAWDTSFEELRAVAAGNGGVAHVTRRDPERPALGRWCNEQVRDHLQYKSYHQLRRAFLKRVLRILGAT